MNPSGLADRIDLRRLKQFVEEEIPKKFEVVTSVDGKKIIRSNINYSSGHGDLEVSGKLNPVTDLLTKLATFQHANVVGGEEKLLTLERLLGEIKTLLQGSYYTPKEGERPGVY